MKIDLTKDREKIRRYVSRRIRDYPVYVNDGPGQDEDPIQAIMLGFYAEQGGHIYLVFDTRPGKNIDGNWTLHIDEPNMLHFPKWCSLYETACEGHTVQLVLADGKETTLKLKAEQDSDRTDDDSADALNKLFAEMLRNLMLELRDDGTLARLPLREDAYFMIEEFDGRYFWPDIRSVKTKGRILRNNNPK